MFEDDEFEKQEFNKWNIVKTDLELHGRQPKISQGEIWWSGVGKNLGSEINGKNERFSRPVLVYRKLGRNKFMAIPLTSKDRQGTWYVSFMQGGEKQTAVVAEARSMSTKRLYRKMGEIDDADYERVQKGFVSLFG